MSSRTLDNLTIDQLLKEAVVKKASDIHLVVGKPPIFRIDGRLVPQGKEPLTTEDTKRLAFSTMSERIKDMFDKEFEVDYSYSLGTDYRFRVNVFTQKECVSAVFRYIPSKILSLKELGLPPVLETFTRLPRGLVLVTGSTGSGKSTTLASMIDMINNERDVHIVTIEDPIEFIHHHKKSLINQREIGQDSLSFQRALKSVLREDPDVILLGEMRDLETIATAVTLAETGHLVFATLHTTSASQTVDRIIDVFPPEQQEQIRFQLSNVLEAIVTQTLLPKIGGGRVCACEILVMNSAARASIRNNKSTVLNDIMQMGSKLGMQTLEQSLVKLVTKGLVEKDVALGASSHPDILKQMLQK